MVRKDVAAIILTLLVVYHANGRPLPEVDVVPAPYTAWSLVRYGSLDLRPYPELQRYVGTAIRELPDGSWVSMRPPGAALVAVPFVVPFVLLLERPIRVLGMVHLGKLAAAVSIACAAALFFIVCKRLVPSAAWPATILFALGTTLYSVASQALWMHGPATFYLCSALFFLTCEDADSGMRSSATGLAFGLAILTRPSTAFFALATGITFIIQRRWRGLTGLFLGGIVPMAFLVGLNTVQFGHPVLGGYVTDNWSESPPLWVGLGGLLIAPSRGVLVYSPALLLVPLGVRMLLTHKNDRLKSMQPLLFAWLLASLATVLFYARWHDWRGGWTYGPRFLTETMPVLCLLFGLGYASFRAVWPRRIALGLVALSVAIQFLGVFGYSGYAAWQKRHDLPDQGRSLFSLEDTQIEAHTRALLSKLTGTNLRRP